MLYVPFKLISGPNTWNSQGKEPGFLGDNFLNCTETKATGNEGCDFPNSTVNFMSASIPLAYRFLMFKQHGQNILNFLL